MSVIDEHARSELRAAVLPYTRRKERAFVRATAAAHLGITPQALGMVLSGKRHLKKVRIERLATLPDAIALALAERPATPVQNFPRGVTGSGTPPVAQSAHLNKGGADVLPETQARLVAAEGRIASLESDLSAVRDLLKRAVDQIAQLLSEKDDRPGKVASGHRPRHGKPRG